MNEQFIGNYKILQRVGSGGMARVYLAVHQDIPNLRVVLKVLSDPRLAERFKQEADKLALLDGHPHICQIKHFFNHNDDFVIAMEYIEGMTLEEYIKSARQVPVDEAIKITSEVLNILAFAHQKKIYHRDIKPGNIMLDKKGQVKIIDFGIAKAETDPNLTLAGTSCGTPAYMSPEQFTPNESVDYALVDVYAVGTTLYYMVTGELPFKGDNEFALRDAKLFQEPVKPSKLNSAVSSKLDNLILKSMSKNPSDRYPSAEAMLQALAEISPGVKTPAPVESHADEKTVSITTGEVVQKMKSKTPLIIAGSLIVVAVVVIAVIFMGKEALPPEPPTLLSPINDDLISTSFPTFRWSGPEENGLKYTFEYALDSSFATPGTRSNLTSTDYKLDDSLGDGVYYWRVRAVDADGRLSKFSRIFSFEIELPELIADTSEERADTGESSTENNTPVNNNAREERKPPKPKPVEIKTGQIRIGSKPYLQAEIFINGKKTNEQTPFTFTRDPGSYEIKVMLDRDGQILEAVDTVEVRPDTLMTYILQLEE